MHYRAPLTHVAALVGVVFASLLAGCDTVSPLQISEQARARIHVVSVNPTIVVPPDFSYLGPKQSAAMMLGGPLVGALMANNSASEPKALLLAEMQANHISLANILAAEFAKQASAGSPMKFVVGTAPADAQVQLVIHAYGIGQAQPFGSTLYPLMNVSAVMTAADGTVIWQATDIASPTRTENKEGHTYEEYMKDPDLLRQAFVNGSDIASVLLTKNLMGLESSRSVPGIQR